GAGAELISASFSTVFGSHVGSLLIAICISLFAFSTILSWALYGTRCFEYLFKSKAVKMYQIAFLIVIVIGACLKLSLVWDIADALNGMMILPNLVALILLSPVVIKATNDYFR
ncbi:MAG: alanine:cation symporter family protein, partial [Erysipelotrichaceae bacterium]|nr:alanine:cation symporter family protein [Erysipelotrichaceae bacterium]